MSTEYSYMKSNRKKFIKNLYDQRYLILMALPMVAWVIIFSYLPIWGWTMAFQDYIPGLPFNEQAWVGFSYFTELFSDPQFFRVLWNTFAMSTLQVFFAGFFFPILFALFLNEIRNQQFKRTVQPTSFHDSTNVINP